MSHPVRERTCASLVLGLGMMLSGCGGGRTVSERLDALLPQRTSSENAAWVQSQVTARAAPGNPALSRVVAGVWTGTLSYDGSRIPVTGAATASGLILLTGDRHGFTLDQVTVGDGRFHARIVLPDGTARVVTGRHEPGTFEGVLLPTGWTLSDYLGGRSPDESELPKFGSLRLRPDDTAPPAPALDVMSRRVRGDGPGGSYAGQLDQAGNLAMVAPGCELSGAVMRSPSVGQLYELSVHARGSNCPATGPSVGVARLKNEDALEVWLLNDGRVFTLKVPRDL